MSRIWNTLEYQLSDGDAQLWATRSGYPKFNLVDHIESFPTEVTISIDTNAGIRDLTFPIKVDGIYVEPALPRVRSRFCFKGKNPLAKRSISFERLAFTDHPDIVSLKKILHDKLHELNENHFNNIRAELYTRLAPTAKAAIRDDVIGMVSRGEHEKLLAWLVSHQFKNIPVLEKLKAVHSMADLCWIPVTQGNSFGHSHGSNLKIDWEARVFQKHGWSSDD